MRKLFLTVGVIAIVMTANAQKKADNTKIDTNGKYQIVSVSGTVFDIQGGKTDKGANLQLWDNNKSVAQQFMFIATSNGFYHIKGVGSGKVLDISGGKDTKYSNIQIWDPNYTVAQKFKLQPAGGGYFFIQTPQGNYLTSETIHMGKSSNVFLWRKKGEFAKWKLVKL